MVWFVSWESKNWKSLEKLVFQKFRSSESMRRVFAFSAIRKRAKSWCFTFRQSRLTKSSFISKTKSELDFAMSPISSEFCFGATSLFEIDGKGIRTSNSISCTALLSTAWFIMLPSSSQNSLKLQSELKFSLVWMFVFFSFLLIPRVFLCVFAWNGSRKGLSIYRENKQTLLQKKSTPSSPSSKHCQSPRRFGTSSKKKSGLHGLWKVL